MIVRPRWLVLPALLVAALSSAGNGQACPFCMEGRGPTLADDFNRADMVMVGFFENPRLSTDGLAEGKTDFKIAEVLKDHGYLKAKKKVTLPRYLTQTKQPFLVYADLFKDSLDPYRGVEIQPKGELVAYLKGLVKLKDQPDSKRLAYCVDYLPSQDLEVSLDAYREFAKADYKDYKDMAAKLDPDRVAGWLTDPKTPPYRYGLYASLLGHCGKDKHAQVIKGMIDDPEKRRGSGIDGLLAAYVMLRPQDGWQFVRKIIQDTNQEFFIRYAGLRTIRFLWEQRPDLIERKDLQQGLVLTAQCGDIADFAIEDLRRQESWKSDPKIVPKILELFDKETHDLPVVRRSILRYALHAARDKVAPAQAFVDRQRKMDAEWVRDVEELLLLEPEFKK